MDTIRSWKGIALGFLISIVLAAAFMPALSFAEGGDSPAAKSKEFYAVFNTAAEGDKVANTLSFYYDDQKAERQKISTATVYDNLPTAASSYRSWGYYAKNGSVAYVVIDESVKDYHGLTSTAYMFYKMDAASGISGCEYLDVSSVTNMNSMFYYYAKNTASTLKPLDLSGWTITSLKSAKSMFNSYNQNASGDKPIVYATDWSTINPNVSADDMFKNAKLKGTTGSWESANTSANGCFTPVPLTFTAEEAGSTVSFKWLSGSNVQARQKKAADEEWGAWATYTKNSTITLAAAGDKVQFKGTSVTTDYQNYFTMSGKIAASGDVTSLTNETGGDATLTNQSYRCMFKNCTSLVTAPALPSTGLARQCYGNMFLGCASLVTAPALPATQLTDYCYSNMFEGCTSLATAPALPATTLANSCYCDMFSGCTSLKTAPALSATTLADQCCSGMFQGCTSLETAPALSATMLAPNCYEYMFYGCTSLETAPALPATTLANSCYQYMFNGCTKLASAPALPATSLAIYCYRNMFKGCTSLTAAPNLPATALANNCYNGMFNGCTSLVTAPELKATALQNGCYKNMFNGCTALAFSENGTQPATGGKVFTCPDTTGLTDSVTDMFANTSGSFKGTPEKDNIYYWNGISTITFDMQGYGTQVEAQTVQNGEKVEKPDNPSETGYAFGGWYKEEACTNAWDFDTDTVTADTTLFAQWTVRTTSVTLDANGGTAGSKTSVEAAYGSDMPALTETGNLPTKAGNSFAGYFDAATGGKQYYNADGTSANTWDKDASTATLYAQWTLETYSITYEANDGEWAQGYEAPGQYTVEDEVALPGAAHISKTNYAFAGWYDNEALEGDPVTAIEEGSTGDKEFYAKWTPETYSITYEANDGEWAQGYEAPGQYTVEDEVALPGAAHISKTGYAFAGWYDNEAFEGDPVAAIEEGSTGDKEFYAKWTEAYSVSIEAASHGVVTADKTSGIAEGETVTLTVTPDEGYELDELNVTDASGATVAVIDSTFAMPASDVTVAAAFKAKPEPKPEPDPAIVVPSDGSVKVTEETKAALANAQAQAASYYGVQGATDVKITFKVEAAQAAQADDVALIKKAAGNSDVLAFSVLLTADYTEADGTKVTGAEYGSLNDQVIPVTYAFDFAKKQDIKAFRVHNGELAELTETPNGAGEFVKYDKAANTITVNASKYSTYAFSYKAVADDPTPDPKPVIADTGDSATTAVAALALVALVAAAGIFFARRGRREF